MKKIIGLLFILSFLSCEKEKPKKVKMEDLNNVQIDSVLNKFRFHYEKPIVLDSSDYMLIPISTKLFKTRKTYTRDGYEDGEFPRFWNALFYNRKTNQTRLLIEKKVRISEIFTKSDQYNRRNHVMPQKIFYKIGDIDYNDDKRLDYKDPDFLFVSDVNGKNLIKISPENEDLQTFEIIPNTNQILVRTMRDTNKDKEFRNGEELIWYKVENNNNNWQIRELIDSTQRSKIENLYFEQWLKNSN